jgi:16S rRNA (cytidine1402-2'-O)-methyltransferase
LILAEDSRKTGILLKHLNIHKKIFAHHKFNEHKTFESLVKRMGKGENFAMVTDAGTPAISDPGFLLVRACIESGIEVECLPGPTAFVPALVVSGFPSDKFCFEGFLPVKKGRMKRLKELKEENRTIVFYESPHRLLRFLQQILDVFGDDRRISVSRELTKIHEETKRGSIQDLIAYFSEKSIKGEIVVVLEGKK